jgi:DNA/RNA-binding domain of Phe-tRNA-synthetase-like protein
MKPEPSVAGSGAHSEQPEPSVTGPGANSEPPEPERGWCEREVREELPGLHLVHSRSAVDRVRRDSPPAVRARLATLSNRWAGPHAIGLRQRPVPAAYRVFFRHIGLDPDVVRTPIEEAMLARMMQGGFHSNHLLADALLITLVDTGVPVWAFDAATIEDPLGIRASREGERFGRPPARTSGASPLPGGRLVVADARTAVAVLFGELAPGHAAGVETNEVMLFTLQVPGVPSLHVGEALWMCRAMLEGPW